MKLNSDGCSRGNPGGSLVRNQLGDVIWAQASFLIFRPMYIVAEYCRGYVCIEDGWSNIIARRSKFFGVGERGSKEVKCSLAHSI